MPKHQFCVTVTANCVYRLTFSLKFIDIISSVLCARNNISLLSGRHSFQKAIICAHCEHCERGGDEGRETRTLFRCKVCEFYELHMIQWLKYREIALRKAFSGSDVTWKRTCERQRQRKRNLFAIWHRWKMWKSTCAWKRTQEARMCGEKRYLKRRNLALDELHYYFVMIIFWRDKPSPLSHHHHRRQQFLLTKYRVTEMIIMNDTKAKRYM